MIGCRIAFSDISAFSYFKDQITNYCNKSDGLSHDELRALSSAQIAILHRTSSGRKLKYEKKETNEDRILKHCRFNGTLRI